MPPFDILSSGNFPLSASLCGNVIDLVLSPLPNQIEIRLRYHPSTANIANHIVPALRIPWAQSYGCYPSYTQSARMLQLKLGPAKTVDRCTNIGTAAIPSPSTRWEEPGGFHREAPVSSFHLLLSRLFKELFALVVHVFKQVVHQGRNLIFKYKGDNQNND